ncbi:hypothetical protein SUNI508_05357 [Seiridium unicorne]|uniref:C2H2-type domain-containing protein n=1 Tax=Seiridium unicorne TaxID=138068 RepID=A0ABR2V4I1_9PEZI
MTSVLSVPCYTNGVESDALAPLLIPLLTNGLKSTRRTNSHTFVRAQEPKIQHDRSPDWSLASIQWYHHGDIDRCEASRCDSDSLIDSDQETTSYWQHCDQGLRELSLENRHARLPIYDGTVRSCSGPRAQPQTTARERIINQVLQWVGQVVEAETKGTSGVEPTHGDLPFLDLNAPTAAYCTGTAGNGNGKRPIPPRGPGKDAEESDSSQEEQLAKRPKPVRDQPEREHVYRRHALPKYQCSRCRDAFPTHEDLISHQRADVPCACRDDEPRQGISPEQAAQLRRRRKGTTTETGKWLDMYRIIFPDDNLSGLPAPYYEYPEEATKAQHGKAYDQESEWGLEYEDFLCGEFPTSLQDEFHQSVQAQLGISDPKLQRRVIDLALKFQLRLLAEFQAQRQSNNMLENDENIEGFPDMQYDLELDAEEPWSFDFAWNTPELDIGSHISQRNESEAPATANLEKNSSIYGAQHSQSSNSHVNILGRQDLVNYSHTSKPTTQFGPQVEPFNASQQITDGDPMHTTQGVIAELKTSVPLLPVSHVELDGVSIQNRDIFELNSYAPYTFGLLPRNLDRREPHPKNCLMPIANTTRSGRSNIGADWSQAVADGWASTTSANGSSSSGLIDAATTNIQIFEQELSLLKRERDELNEKIRVIEFFNNANPIPGDQPAKQILSPRVACRGRSTVNTQEEQETKTRELERRFQDLEADQQHHRAPAQFDRRSPVTLAPSSPAHVVGSGHGPVYVAPTPPRWLSPVRSPGAPHIPQQVQSRRASGYNSSASGYDSGGGYPASPSSGPLQSLYSYHRGSHGEWVSADDLVTFPQTGSFRCTFPGCMAQPFQTQYLLNSHANVHSSERPYYCPVRGCPRAEGGKGFKRKNEMIRHGLAHESPGYVCPFCTDRKHKYPRPDNLQRHVRIHHPAKDKNDPELREVFAQRPDGPKRRLAGFVTER